MQTSSSDVSQQGGGLGSGTSTPKDLAARVSIIELFTLHVLPRNGEWEYASEFINMSQALDEERKETFMQALEGVKEEKQMGELRAAEIQRGKDAEMDKQKREAERQAAEEEKEAAAASAAAAAASAERSEQTSSKRGGSEAGGGSEKNSLNGNAKGKKSTSKSTGRKSSPAPAAGSRAISSQSSSAAKNANKPERQGPRPGQIGAAANAIRNLVRHISQSASKNPLPFLRLLLFVLGIVMALGKQNVRERVGRLTNTGWRKVKGTIGMGTKVSYI